MKETNTIWHVIEKYEVILIMVKKLRWSENLAWIGDGMWKEALNFLDSSCFVPTTRDESPSGRTIVEFIIN